MTLIAVFLSVTFNQNVLLHSVLAVVKRDFISIMGLAIPRSFINGFEAPERDDH